MSATPFLPPTSSSYNDIARREIMAPSFSFTDSTGFLPVPNQNVTALLFKDIMIFLGIFSQLMFLE